MSDNKIYKKLPAVLHTTAIKNFFENTVEQLFSQAQVEQIQGYIGSPSADDVGASGSFLPEPTVTKRFYGLTPTVNTINSTTGRSENLFFYDELVDTLKTYGVTVNDHNKIFSSNYATFIPPVCTDKLINYAEYYWYPDGPSVITVSGTPQQPIDIHRDVLRQSQYTPPDQKPFRNGMIVTFVGDYVIPADRTGIRYVIEGVGRSIQLIPFTQSEVRSSSNAKVTYHHNGENQFVLTGGSTEFEPATQSTLSELHDYMVQQRGAHNHNAWSRQNCWFHKQNFLDAGNALPGRQYRANRPIIQFDSGVEMYNHGVSAMGAVVISVTQSSYNSVAGLSSNSTIDGVPLLEATLVFPEEQLHIAQHIYIARDNEGVIQLEPITTASGELWIPQLDDTIHILQGEYNQGKEYRWTNSGWALTQQKTQQNQAPLFNLYDVNGDYLGDHGVYPDNNFQGNKLFNYATRASEHSVISSTNDSELGFPLVYRQFNASSEIQFEVYAETQQHEYTPVGATQPAGYTGYAYYKLLDKDATEYHNMWHTVREPSRQRIVTTHNVTQIEQDRSTTVFFVGCEPNVAPHKHSGRDIDVTVNNQLVTNYVYSGTPAGFIQFDAALTAGDFVEIRALSDSGLIQLDSVSKFQLPLSWDHNTQNNDILYTSEPEYLSHFSEYMRNQSAFTGEVLGSNNFSNTQQDPRHATRIVQTDQDLVLGAFLLDDQPHNLVDALRFNANEYAKYRARLLAEIDKYYNSRYTEGNTTEHSVEQVLRSLISYNVGRAVFNRTYVLPYGDNYEQQQFIAATDQRTFVLDSFADLDQLENSLLVYRNDTLLCVDQCYVITNFNPITVEIQQAVPLSAGDRIVTKLYNAERDSAQCPPTPSTMGLYPLYQPNVQIDNTYRTPIEVIQGHDGSVTPTFGDHRDDILLAIERRIYNSAKAEFRESNALPEYNIFDVRPGAFRTTGYTRTELNDLMRHQFSVWTSSNNVNAVENEFFDQADQWTWNYSNDTTAGHWRGLYEHYYDTTRPHTHPWEMLGFTEKPLWWDTQYPVYADSDTRRLSPTVDYSRLNTAMWQDLEQGIIRQGARENVSGDRYLTQNPYRRVGLSDVIPVDDQGQLISPYELFSTGTTALTAQWQLTQTEQHDPDFVSRTHSFQRNDGVSVSFDTESVYVTNTAATQSRSHAIPRIQLDSNHAHNSSMIQEGAVAVLVNAMPLNNIVSADTWMNQGEWTRDTVRDRGQRQLEDRDESAHYWITPDVIGLTDWSTTEHSPIVGWAFDGLPIYGPYVYSDPTDSNSEITRAVSSWRLRDGSRHNGPGGAYTGVFIEDYVHDSTVSGTAQYADAYNKRYAVTPESRNQRIGYYVVTVDEDHNPVFPYHVGGGTQTKNTLVKCWANRYFGASANIGQIQSVAVVDRGGQYNAATTTIQISGDGVGASAVPVIQDGEIVSVTVTDRGRNYTYATAVAVSTDSGVRAKLAVIIDDRSNHTNNAPVNETATTSFSSSLQITNTITGDISSDWKFGDGAPVENAWKTSQSYPFAVAEALLLAKPGKFATVFSDPTILSRPAVDRSVLLDVNTARPWKFTQHDQFRVHGDTDADGNFVTNIGYTQFINSWIKFQGLDTTLEFVDKLRTINVKLAHRMSGYVDKDTMIARTDQYSSSGNASSLIVPSEDYAVELHSSNYKSRNFYTGVIIEKTNAGYRVRGFDRTRGYFEVLQSNTRGKRERVSVGGNPVAHTDWQPNQTYKRGTIVEYLNSYYIADKTVVGGASFDRSVWDRLPSLPQEGAATATLYQETTGNTLRVNYETEFTRVDQVYDFLISLGRYQRSLGFDFGQYRTDINAVGDWAYSAKQFLFWTTGKWETGNTIELSPLSTKLKFSAPRGFIAKINRSDREQFSILDQNGAVIDPTQCSIVRENDYIEIVPPGDQQIYAVKLYVKEVEHAVVFNNMTQFGDVIFDDVLYQRHSRIKIKAQRTKNWTGKFLSEGFIIDGSELKPNLDNLAESMGRYHEFGFIPVEKQIYQASRALFGFTDQEHMRELDIVDDQQFEFYRGMIQSKGTSESLTRIARSSAIAQGDVTVYDEWALRAGDFGDTDKEQHIEILLNRQEIVQDPQLITLDFPESVTNVLDRIDVVDARYTYTAPPEIQVGLPNPGGLTAQASAILDSQGKLSAVTVLDPGSNYADSISVNVIAANVLVNNSNTRLNPAVAKSSSYVDIASEKRIELSVTGASNVELYANSVVSMVDNINSNADINSHVTASVISSDVISSGVASQKLSVMIAGDTFQVVDCANINIASGVYQPQQRFGVFTAEASQQYQTTQDDVSVLIDGVALNRLNSDSTENWQFDAGEVITLSPDAVYPLVDTSAERVDTVYFPVINNQLTIPFGNTTIAADNLQVNSENQYRFVELYIDGVRIQNTVNTYDNADLDQDGAPDILTQGTVFELHQDRIHFPNIALLPKSVLTKNFNPPYELDANTGTELYPTGNQPRELVFSLTPDTEIKLVEKATVQFTDAVTTDTPGAVVNIKVRTNEGIVARVASARTFELSADDVNDDVITIDIDDATRFLKKPRGIKNTVLWPTTHKVNHTGVTDVNYAVVPNSGYVNAANVTFQAFDLASLPDLYSEQLLIKPRTGDYIHVAKSENNDWNVYQLTNTAATKSFLSASDTGEVSLFTDHSLFNYLDTNQIGETNTGKYLDYYLTLNNANVSDRVVVWRNEEIVRSRSYELRDFESPKAIEARIASIRPRNLVTITALEPADGRIYNNLTATPLEGNTVLISGNNFTDIELNDAVRLFDNVGTRFGYSGSYSVNTLTLTVNARHVQSISVDNSGSNYTVTPNVIISASTTGDNATATATVVNGEVVDITVDSTGSGYTGTATVTVESPGLSSITVTEGGSGYSANDPPTVTVEASDTGHVALAEAVILGNSVVEIALIDSGHGYSSVPTVTISAPLSGSTATATAILNSTATATVTMNNGVEQLAQEIAQNGSARIQLTGEANSSLALREDPPLTTVEQQLLGTINEILFTPFTVSSVNESTGTFSIQSDLFTDDAISNITNSGYAVSRYLDYEPSAGEFYTVNDVTATSFTIQRENSEPGTNLSAMHLNKSMVTVPGHNFSAGDTVRMYTNNLSGLFTVQAVLSDKIVLPAKYVSGFTSGEIIQEGIEIKTVGEHGISSLYAKNNKRIAVHFAEPLYYNKVYPVSQVTPDTIIVNGFWPKDRQTYTYYEEVTATLNASVPFEQGNVMANSANATNVIAVTADVRLGDYQITYNSNSDVISPAYVTTALDYYVIDPRALPANTDLSVNVTVTRQSTRSGNRYAVLTTLDHNKVVMNGSTVEVDQYDTSDDIARSINKNIQLRRAFTKSDSGAGRFGLNIAMLKNPRATATSGAYITDAAQIAQLSNNQLPVTATISDTVSNARADNNVKVGPHRGFNYRDDETGIAYKWDPLAQKYRPTNTSAGANQDLDAAESAAGVTQKAPEYHVSTLSNLSEILPWAISTSADVEALPTNTVVYVKDAVVSYGQSYYVATQDITVQQNTSFDSNLWQPVTNPAEILGLLNSALILKTISGNGSDTSQKAGVKQQSYDMLSTTEFNGGAITLPTYRLMPNTQNVFLVYQAVQNTADQIYYVLVDKVSPPNAPHDFYGTVNAHSDLFAYPTTDYYYKNNITPSLTGGKIANSNDPVRLQNTGRVIELPPVEPAAYIGRQLIPEPYAVSAGNNTDAAQNFFALPELSIGSAQSGGRTVIKVNSAGHNQFLMWTAGLEPGKWEPTTNGPGPLPGATGVGTLFGYGRGYYAPGDGHISQDYPAVGAGGWSQPQPRLLYNKRFSVYPTVTNREQLVYIGPNGVEITKAEFDTAAAANGGEAPDDYTILTSAVTVLDQLNENPENENVRPEEIFVACFWTEPHLYRNQLTGWDYNNLTNAGTPSPVYSDYNGTVCRVKYIRLTELPENAFTRRLIPDTGWAGKAWNNIRVDDVLNTDLDQQEIWQLFSPNTQRSGSTGDDTETSVGIQGTTTALSNNAVVDQQGDLLAANTLSASDTIPVTAVGPILSGSVLESLPGPCVAVPPPEIPVLTDNNNAVDCKRSTTQYVYDVFTNRSTEFRKTGTSHGYFSVKIHDEDAVRVFFDFTSTRLTSAAVIMVQSRMPYDPNYASWWTDAGVDAVLLRDTRHDGGTVITNGQQVGRYGIDPYSTATDSRFDNRVNELLGISTSDVSGTIDFGVPQNVVNSVVPRYSAGVELACKGTGFIQRRVDCAQGDHITVIVLTSESDNALQDTTDLWSAVVSYRYEYFAETAQDTVETCEQLVARSGSRFYQQGALFRRWAGGGERDSYFGTLDSDGDGSSGANGIKVDNIYYPYNNYPADLHGGVEPKDANKNALNGTVQRVEDKIITELAAVNTDMNSLLGDSQTTFEIKGYFRAPVTGVYQFKARADDGLWMWLSSINLGGVRRGVDDLADNEYFVQDGYRGDDLYNYTRDNYLCRVGSRTTKTSFDDKAFISDDVELEQGKYYFVRILWGNRGGPGKYELSYSVKNTSITGQGLEFSGRTCPGDNPPANPDPTDGVIGGDTGGSNTGGNTGGGGGSSGGSSGVSSDGTANVGGQPEAPSVPPAGVVLLQYCELDSNNNRTGILIIEVADGKGGTIQRYSRDPVCAPINTGGGGGGSGGGGIGGFDPRDLQLR